MELFPNGTLSKWNFFQMELLPMGFLLMAFLLMELLPGILSVDADAFFQAVHW